MPRASKIIAGLALALLLGLAAAAALLTAPRVQRALARRALRAAGATGIDLGQLRVGLSGLATDHLELHYGALELSGDAVEIRARPLEFLRERRIHLVALTGRNLQVSWDVAARPSGPAAANANGGGGRKPPAAAPKPPRWIVDHLDLSGRFTLRSGAQTLQTAQFRLVGGGLAPGAAADLDCDVAWEGGGQRCHSAGTIRLEEGKLGLLDDAKAAIDVQFEAPDVAKIQPDLAVAGPLHGRLRAAAEAKAGTWTLTEASVSLAGSNPRAAFAAELRQPLAVYPWRTPAAGELAMTFSHLPLAWANPRMARFFPSAGAAFDAAALSGGATLRLAAGELSLRDLSLELEEPGFAQPIVAVKLGQPLPLDRAALQTYWQGETAADIATISSQNIPLEWLSPWLPAGDAVAGRLVGGACTLRSAKGVGLVVETTRPWTVQGFRFFAGDREFFAGDLQVSPRLVYRPQEQEFELRRIEVAERRGGRLSGRFKLDRRSRDGRLAAETDLVVDLPHLPHSAETFGALRVSIAAAGQIHPAENRGDLSKLALEVSDSRGTPLLTVDASRPVRVERTASAEWLLSSAAPLRFDTAGLPLEWINPYLGPEGLLVRGQLQPAAMRLWLSPRHAKVASVQPLGVREFHFEREGRTLLDRASLSVGTELDLDLTYRLLPKLAARYSATIALTDGVATSGGAGVARFGDRLAFDGDERSGRLTSAAGTLWADLGALGRLPLFQRARLPEKGELSLTLSDIPHRADAVAVNATLSHLVGHDGRPVPNLDVSGRARLDPAARAGGLRVQALLHSSPRPSDVSFLLRIDNRNLSILDSNSALKSAYLNFDDIKRFISAFAPAVRAAPAPPPAAGAKVAREPPAPRAAAVAPAWGNLRGNFALDVGELESDGYTLSNLSGRLALADDTLSLSSLAGDIFGAHWSAALTAKFRPGDPAGDHALAAQFQLRQLDAGRLIAQRFPHDAPAIAARLDLNLSLSSQASRMDDLFSRLAGTFSVETSSGELHLSLPGQDMRPTISLLGTVTFSPELRALSRLIGELSDMPLSRCRASGELAANGRLSLEHLQVDAPQLELDLSGDIADAKAPSLVAQPLAARATMAARGDMAVILGGMGLLGKPGADGFRPVTEPFGVGGTVGKPDVHELYDLLARAVSGSHGTWRLLMKKAEARIH